MHFSPVFDFLPAQSLTIMHRCQLTQRGILTEVDAPPIQLRILKNVLISLQAQLKKTSRYLYAVNLHTEMSCFRLSSEPDLAIISPYQATPYLGTWFNPVLILEVICPDDEHQHKFQQYRQIASLHEYVRINPTRCLVEHFIKQSDGTFQGTQIENKENSVFLTSVGCYLFLVEVYDKIDV